jgi:hypothetical protein
VCARTLSASSVGGLNSDRSLSCADGSPAAPSRPTSRSVSSLALLLAGEEATDDVFPSLLFQVGCRTDGGLTVILVPRQEGVETKQMTTRYSKAAGTAYITFDNVRVPVENTLGEENMGIVRPPPPSHPRLLSFDH